MEDIFKRCTDPSCFDRDPSLARNAQYPPDRSELGNAGWLFLHTFATKYPDNPGEEDRIKTLAFLYSFAELYPCSVCRDGLVDIYRRMPPKVDCRRNLLLWTSRLHNFVNRDIGKSIENLTYDQLMEKYG